MIDSTVIVAVISGICTLLGSVVGLPECMED